MKRKKYWVYLNGKYIADYRTLRGCLDFIERRKLEANYDNDLGIIDNEGNEYHPYTGKMMNESLRENLSLNESNIKEIKRTLNYNDLIRTIEHITGAFDVTYTQEINDMVIHIYEPDYRGTYICVKVFDYMYGDVYFSEEVKYERSETCYRKIYNAYKKAVSLCEKDSLMESKRINEWNMWDGDRRSSYPRQTRMIDDRKPIHNKARYNNDPEYHEHIKRLEDELRRTDDPQHAEYLERRISKLKSLVEGVKLSRTSRAINEMARKKKVYQVVAKCDYRDRSTEYVCDEFPTKREALRYRKEECYDTPSRCHIIREVIKDDINEGEKYILNEMKSSNNRKWDVEVFTTYGGISYLIEKTPTGWRFAVDGHDSGRRWETRPNIEKMLSGKIKRIDRYQWSNNDVEDFHEVEYPDRDKNFIGGVGKGRR